MSENNESMFVDLISASDEELMRISKEGMLSLNLEEMKKIREYFTLQKRNPTDLELETLAQTWSEHCKHKVFNSEIEYYENGKKEIINNLFESTIKRATEEIRRKKGKRDLCVSVFIDNAGIIKFNSEYNLVFKVETHNHPSALDPYGGANTGIGGVIRDVLGTGLGAKPIFNTDVFCFAEPDFRYEDLPKGVLHPKRILKGVVAGVRDYGNRMGIPTINGSIHFDHRYLGNPIVYCGTAGIIPVDKCRKSVKKGDYVLLIGGKTGRDGIHGATFASIELDSKSEETSSSAVQIGNPIEEKKVLDVILKARDEGLYTNITDCGAGGLSSAVGEMAKELGVEVWLENVPLKYGGMKPWEIFLSEAQERMVLAVPSENLERILEICRAEDVSATVIGKFKDDKKLTVTFKNKIVGELDMVFLHEGYPRIKKEARWEGKKDKKFNSSYVGNLNDIFLKVISTYNIASKEWVIRQYDHEVQGGSIIKPLMGRNNDGPSDASVVKPILDRKECVIVSNGINTNYGDIDPYWMAVSAVDEALRGIVAVGGEVENTALLDNFCWGNPERPLALGALVRAAKGCYDAAVAYETPFISGKDSFYNEFFDGEKYISIPPTLLISAISVVKDYKNLISVDFKKCENQIYVVGVTKNEVGGSQYLKVMGWTDINVPHVDFKMGKKIMKKLNKAIKSGSVVACHDISEGGLAVAIAEMCIAGRKGAEIFLQGVPSSQDAKNDDIILFSESNSRFVVEVQRDKQIEFEKVMNGVPFGIVGVVCKDDLLNIYGLTGSLLISETIERLKEVWQKPLKF